VFGNGLPSVFGSWAMTWEVHINKITAKAEVARLCRLMLFFEIVAFLKTENTCLDKLKAYKSMFFYFEWFSLLKC
jgi:hypothetical protein